MSLDKKIKKLRRKIINLKKDIRKKFKKDYLNTDKSYGLVYDVLWFLSFHITNHKDNIKEQAINEIENYVNFLKNRFVFLDMDIKEEILLRLKYLEDIILNDYRFYKDSFIK